MTETEMEILRIFQTLTPQQQEEALKMAMLMVIHNDSSLDKSKLLTLDSATEAETSEAGADNV